jgi:hypothetical protein
MRIRVRVSDAPSNRSQRRCCFPKAPLQAAALVGAAAIMCSGNRILLPSGHLAREVVGQLQHARHVTPEHSTDACVQNQQSNR